MRWLIGIDLLASHHEFGIPVGLHLAVAKSYNHSCQVESVPCPVTIFTDVPQEKSWNLLNFAEILMKLIKVMQKPMCPKR